MCDCASPFPLSCRNLAGYLRSWQICASRLFRPTWLKESFSVISHDFTKAQLSVLPWTSQDISNHFKSYIACARLQTAMRSRGCSLERSSKRNKTPWTRHRTIGGVPWGQNTTFFWYFLLKTKSNSFRNTFLPYDRARQNMSQTAKKRKPTQPTIWIRLAAWLAGS